jgi:hypothetical protein
MPVGLERTCQSHLDCHPYAVVAVAAVQDGQYPVTARLS